MRVSVSEKTSLNVDHSACQITIRAIKRTVAGISELNGSLLLNRSEKLSAFLPHPGVTLWSSHFSIADLQVAFRNRSNQVIQAGKQLLHGAVALGVFFPKKKKKQQRT